VRVRNWMIGLTLLLALAFANHVAARTMIARAVLPPHATRFQILIAALNSPYQMAAPHYSLRKELTGFFTTTVVRAQDTGCGGLTNGCSGYKAMAMQNEGCSQNNDNKCPDCVNGPCVVWGCTYTGASSDICDDSYYSCNNACKNVGACTQ
jgi:hypothetical protein